MRPEPGGPCGRKGMVAQSNREWTEDELAGIDLGDERLNRRCGQILVRLAATDPHPPQGSVRVVHNGLGGPSYGKESSFSPVSRVAQASARTDRQSGA
jgi:hypothetical protein